MGIKQTLVVIGNGMVGLHFLASFVTGSGKDEYEIVTFCEEPRPAYDRVHLSEFFSGKTAEDLSLVDSNFFEQHNITIHIGDKAAKICRASKTVVSEKGITIRYDKLVLATGSFPFVPPVPGHDRAHCLVYRTIEDLIAIRESAKTGKVGVVVGGGLLGLEAAKALTDLGLQTHVVEFAPRLMTVQLDEAGGAMLRRKIENLGVTVHTGKNTSLISEGEQCINKMCFADGDELETDIVLFSAGIRPRDDIARDCNLEVGSRGGIIINDQCQTSDPDIYAIGVGIIATETGWNLYVCGNGGMKPRHADLFATSLDKETLIKYIDRFLSFYVRTADRLQRTSVWMENMEGSLDYLKSVVIADKLGLCEQLEEQMQHVINSYQCEWKTTIEDASKLKRFHHFVNSDQLDDNIVFVEERGQLRPADKDERKHFNLLGTL